MERDGAPSPGSDVGPDPTPAPAPAPAPTAYRIALSPRPRCARAARHRDEENLTHVESIETVTITNPANPILIWWVIAQPLLLLLSFLVGRLTRFLLRGRVSVSGAAATLIALVGLWLGLLLAGWIFDEGDLFSFKMLATSCGVAVVVLVATSAVLARVQHHPTLLPIAEVAQMGESDRLEFKSSARWNLRTDKRDEAMEEVVAKTVAAFMNSAGGTLLLGVDDGGNLIGLGPDYATLKPRPHPHCRSTSSRPRGATGRRCGCGSATRRGAWRWTTRSTTSCCVGRGSTTWPGRSGWGTSCCAATSRAGRCPSTRPRPSPPPRAPGTTRARVSRAS